jgi:hypothetical protein
MKPIGIIAIVLIAICLLSSFMLWSWQGLLIAACITLFLMVAGS